MLITNANQVATVAAVVIISFWLPMQARLAHC